MKKNHRIAFAGVTAAILMLGAGCANMLESPQAKGDNAGTITVKLDNAARTLLPAAPLAFARYAISFAPGAGQDAVPEIPDADPAVLAGSGQKMSLATGNWTITVTAYSALNGVAGLEKGEYPAAKGSAAVTVSAGENSSVVSITIAPITHEGEGVLDYAAEIAALIKVLTLDGADLDPPISLSLTASAAGTQAIPAGFYLVTGESGSSKAVSVLHIYAGLTTRVVLNADFAFTQKTSDPGNLVLRYEAQGDAFTATPASGASWNATLENGAAIVVLPGSHRVVDVGGNNGYVDLGTQFGALIKTLNAFTVETYLYLPLQQSLEGNGHFVWTFSTSNSATQTQGRYMVLRASDLIFSMSQAGWGSGAGTTSKGSIEKGVWKHLVLTRDSAKEVTLYVDGVLQDAYTLEIDHTVWNNINYNYLARPVFSGDNYLKNARYYRLNLYDKAFSAAEVALNLAAKDILAEFPVNRIRSLPDSVPLKHVGGLHTEEDFARIRANLNVEPWKSSYAKLTANSLAQPSFTPYPTEYINRPSSGGNYINAARSSHAAYQMALRWKISGDNAFATRAVYILNRWAQECKGVTGDTNQSLAAGLYGYAFAVAGELLRDYSGWTSAEFAAFKQWLLDVFYPRNLDFLNRHHDTHIDHYWANWDLCNLASIIAIGIVTDRRDIYNFALDYLQDNRSSVGNGNFFKNINNIHDYYGEELGQMQESGRDQGHATLCIALTGIICQLTWNQGDDFFGFDDNRFLKGCEYVARYNVASLDVPFTTYVRKYGNKNSSPNGSYETHTGVSPASRYTSRPMWALPYYHYAKIKGIGSGKIKYTKMGLDTTFPEGGAAGGSTSGEYDQLGFGTLMYAR
ncbi:MAG: alginate lyase family protein [Treponema sp.]|jgi:hypothetical protein|nr:alginate lyase family protein [Treponema sp.]